MKYKYIFWDFDKTIIDLDTDIYSIKDLGLISLREGRVLSFFKKLFLALLAVTLYFSGIDYKIFKKYQTKIYYGSKLETLLKLTKTYARHVPSDNVKKVKEAKNKGYKNYIVSLSFVQQIEGILKNVGLEGYVDKVMANKFIVKNGTIVGCDFAVDNNDKKVEAIESLGVDLSKAMAIGDGKHDMPMLERVGYPVLLKGNKKLENMAKEKGWKVVNSLSEVKL